jgi:outer membrane receptor protein involved in Fe transport
LTEGGKKAALAAVQQSEVGIRNRGKHAWGNYAAAATLFRSTTEEYTYDQTRKPEDGPKLNQLGYRANGVELETGASFGNFALNFNAVYTDEIMTSNLVEPKKVGLTSGGLPKVRYTISPRYAIGDAVIGAAIRGQSSVFVNGDNTDKINGHYIVSAFANYDFGNGLIGSLNVNNLFNKIYPVAGGGFVGGSTSVFGAGVNTGRTVSATVRYKF